MKILIAPDKFKHSLSSFEACEAIKSGLLNASDTFQIKSMPLADGGDGLLEIIQFYIPSTMHSVAVSDPLFRPISSSLVISSDRQTAFIEMAKASGLLLLKPEEYNCTNTTTFGTGELIKEAISLNAKNIVMGLGGSSTNDCGIGMAAALGFCFRDKDGNQLKPIGKNLIRIEHIDQTNVIDFKHIDFQIACDVKNPLTGKYGATNTYARQKGASEIDIEELEAGMLHFKDIIKKDLGKNVDQIEGAGAAGGLAAGCVAFLNAGLSSGIDIVLNISNAEKYIVEADIIITGEGSIDQQSLKGKVLSGVGMLCKKHNKPAIAFCGNLKLSKGALEKINIRSAYSINPANFKLEEAYSMAFDLLKAKAYAIGLKMLNEDPTI